jgi:hypothetical protein
MMKRFLAVLLAFVFASSPAYADEYSLTVAASGGSAPTLVTDGLNLYQVRGFRVMVCAEATRTLSGAGSLQAYYYHPTSGLWMRNPSLDLSVTASSVRCQVFPDQRVAAVGSGRVFYNTASVTVSAGTNVTIYISASPTQP